MPCATSIRLSNAVAVGMGQAALAADPTRLTTILGACVAVALYAPRRRLGILGHIVLPQSRNAADCPARYADTAVPYMLSILRGEGVGVRELTAKITGGACMFGNGQLAQIGKSNVEGVVQALGAAGIGIAGRDTGGASGRRVVFDLATGEMTIAFVGQPAQIL